MITDLTDPDCVIDKNHSGVSATCNFSTDANSNCLNVDHVCRHFITAFFFFVVAISDPVICFCVAIENVFSSAKKMMLISLDKRFLATVLNGSILYASLLHLVLEYRDF